MYIMPDNIGRRNQTGVRYYIVFVCLVVGEKRGCDVMGRPEVGDDVMLARKYGARLG